MLQAFLLGVQPGTAAAAVLTDHRPTITHDVRPDVSISFLASHDLSQPLDYSNINSSTFYREDLTEGRIVPTASFVSTYYSGSLVKLLPIEPLQNSHKYRAVVVYSNILDINGKNIVLGDEQTGSWEFTIFDSPDFVDVNPSENYAQAISVLSNRGIISGFADGTFRQQDPVSRQQFAKMIVLTLGLPVSESDVFPFADVPMRSSPGLYPGHFVAVAASHGITEGVGGSEFKPYDNISRGQVVTMIVRAAKANWPGLLETPVPGFAPLLGTFDPVHGENVRIAAWNGLLSNLDGIGTSIGPETFTATWDSWQAASRAEVSQMLENLLALVEK